MAADPPADPPTSFAYRASRRIVAGMDRPLSIAEAATLAGVSRRTIHHWVKTGKVDSVRTAGGRVRIYAASLFREVSR